MAMIKNFDLKILAESALSSKKYSGIPAPFNLSSDMVAEWEVQTLINDMAIRLTAKFVFGVHSVRESSISAGNSI